MARKVILDVDPGIDDALALCLALFEPELDVVALTAVGGNVSPAQATRNVQVILEQLDPPRLPRLGAASEPDNGLPVEGRYLYGADGLGGCGFDVAERQHLLPSEKEICDQVRAAPHQVTIVALGPLDQYRPGVHARSRIARPGRSDCHHGRHDKRPGQHNPCRRIQYLLRSGIGPDCFSLAIDENPHSRWT